MNNETDTRYNQVRQKGSHNSYERTEGLYDQMLYWRLRAIELDIHNGKGCEGLGPLAGDWYVYHFCGAGGTESSVDKLSDGLDVLAGFATAVPDHEVVTLVVDLKDDFAPGQTPDDLDALVAGKLGAGNVWGPADLIAASGASTLQQAIAAVGWPTLAELRGRFIVALTGGDVSAPGTLLNQYVDGGAAANRRLGFVAPQLDSAAGIGEHDYVVFFNLDSSHRDLGPQVFTAGLVSRTYALNNADDWQSAETDLIHHFATDKVNALVDPWSRTDNAHGWPFQAIEVAIDPSLTEPGLLYGFEVTSGDIWGESDSFLFAFDQPSDPDGDHRLWISSPASHVQQWAKGAMMARASLDAGAAYLGVFRTGENDLRVQFRPSAGASTEAVEVDVVPPDTVAENGLIYVRLTVTNGGRTAQGWGSLDAVSWTPIASFDFDQPLRYQGWAVSSHGQQAVKFLFGNVDGSAATFPSTAAVGGASGSFFAGVYPP